MMQSSQFMPVKASSQSSSAVTGRQQTGAESRRGSKVHLDVPRHGPLRRSSTDSMYSELSDLSFISNDLHAQALTRRLSNVSSASEYSAASRTSKSSLRQKLYDLYDQNYGALLVLISQAFGSGMNVATRLLEQPGPHGEPMHPFQILFTRQSLTALLCTAYALITKSIPHFPLGPPDRNVRLLLVCRGVLGFFGVFGMYFSLLYLPLSEATVLTFLAPILTCYLCAFIIPGETFTRQQQIAGFVSLIGVVFIAQPISLLRSSSPPSTSTGAEVGVPNPNMDPDKLPPKEFSPIQPTPSQHLMAIGIAMIGVLGATGALTSIRAIGTRAHAFISVNYFSVWSTIVSLVALIVSPDVSFRLPSNVTEWSLLLSLGACGFIMQALLTMGLSYKSTGRGGGSGQPKVDDTRTDDQDIELQDSVTAGPSIQRKRGVSRTNTLTTRRRRISARSMKSSSSGTKATSMVYTQMLFALAGDRLVFGVTPGVWSWIGSGLILTGAIWVASAKDNQKPDTHRARATSLDHEAGLTSLAPGSVSRVLQEEERVGLLDEDNIGGPEETILAERSEAEQQSHLTEDLGNTTILESTPISKAHDL